MSIMTKEAKIEKIQEIHTKYLKNKSKKLHAKLLEYYFQFVKKIAVKVAEKLHWQVQPDELASLGIDGLYKALDGYDPDKGVKFESYANRRIRGSMIDGLRRQDLVPRSVRISSDQFSKHKQRFQNHYGHRISDVDFVAMVGMDEAQFHKSHRKFIPTTFASIDGNIDSDSQEEMKQDSNANLIDSDICQPGARISRREFFSKLMGRDFSPIEQKIIYLYYYENLTMDKVAKSISLSESRVSQMHKGIIARLKEKIERNPEYFGNDVYEFLTESKDAQSLF